jgi:hypothetical protein
MVGAQWFWWHWSIADCTPDTCIEDHYHLLLLLLLLLSSMTTVT